MENDNENLAKELNKKFLESMSDKNNSRKERIEQLFNIKVTDNTEQLNDYKKYGMVRNIKDKRMLDRLNQIKSGEYKKLYNQIAGGKGYEYIPKEEIKPEIIPYNEQIHNSAELNELSFAEKLKIIRKGKTRAMVQSMADIDLSPKTHHIQKEKTPVDEKYRVKIPIFNQVEPSIDKLSKQVAEYFTILDDEPAKVELPIFKEEPEIIPPVVEEIKPELTSEDRIAAAIKKIRDKDELRIKEIKEQLQIRDARPVSENTENIPTRPFQMSMPIHTTFQMEPQFSSFSPMSICEEAQELINGITPEIERTDTLNMPIPIFTNRTASVSVMPLDKMLSIKERMQAKSKAKELALKLQDEERAKEMRKYNFQKKFKIWYWMDLFNQVKIKIKEDITNLIEKYKTQYDDWKFEKSLSDTQKELIKGYKRADSQKLIKLALKKNINLNELKRFNAEMDAIPE